MCQGTWRRSVAKPWLFRPLGGTRGLSSISDLIACKHDWLNIGGLGSSLTLIAGACSRSPGHPAASSSCPQDRGLTTGPTKVSFAHCQTMQLTRPCLSMASRFAMALGRYEHHNHCNHRTHIHSSTSLAIQLQLRLLPIHRRRPCCFGVLVY